MSIATMNANNTQFGIQKLQEFSNRCRIFITDLANKYKKDIQRPQLNIAEARSPFITLENDNFQSQNPAHQDLSTLRTNVSQELRFQVIDMIFFFQKKHNLPDQILDHAIFIVDYCILTLQVQITSDDLQLIGISAIILAYQNYFPKGDYKQLLNTIQENSQKTITVESIQQYVKQVENLVSKQALNNIFHRVNIRFYLQSYLEQKNCQDKQYAQMLYQLADIAFYSFSLISSYKSDLIACACLQQIELITSKNMFHIAESKYTVQEINSCVITLQKIIEIEEQDNAGQKNYFNGIRSKYT